MEHNNVVNRISSPARKKKDDSVAPDRPKYHFCFAPIDMKKAKKMYSLVDKLFGEYDFSANYLNLKDGHYVYLYMDQDHLTHVDFNGDDWTCAETDAVFDKIRSVFRSNNIFFAFTNFKEDK